MPARLFAIIWIAIFGASAGADLDSKLQAQFAKYETTRQAAIDQVGCTDKTIGRDAWEKMLDPGDTNRLTTEDTAALVSRQNQNVQKAKAKDDQASAAAGIDLRKIESQGLTGELCADLPKGAMLHVHPDGTLTPDTAKKLLTAADPPVNKSSLVAAAHTFSQCEVDKLDAIPSGKKYSQLDPGQQALIASLVAMPDKGSAGSRFPEFQSKFGYLKQLKHMMYNGQDPAAAIAEAFLKRAKAQHVDYVEFTQGCPAFSRAALEERSSMAQDLSNKSGVSTRYNCGFARTLNPSNMGNEARGLFNEENQTAPDDKSIQRISGIDLYGSEDPKDSDGRDVSALSAQRIYACLGYMKQKKNLQFSATMHAGEIGDIRDSRDGILLGADRLGHGVTLDQDPVALEYAARKGVPIETNLSSNERIGAVKSLKDHPFLKYLRLGLKVSFSTDDEGIFQTSPNRECELAIKNSDINYAELKQTSYNSIETSFAPPQEKAALKKKLDTDFAAFEQTWSDKTAKGRARAQAAPKSPASDEIKNPCTGQANAASSPAAVAPNANK